MFTKDYKIVIPANGMSPESAAQSLPLDSGQARMTNRFGDQSIIYFYFESPIALFK